LISDFDVTPIKVDRARSSFNTHVDFNNKNNELEMAKQQFLLPNMDTDQKIFANNQSKFRNAS
jgi:hypothetical protein